MLITKELINLPRKKEYGIDRVLVRVADGELVIPRPYSKMVLDHLNEKGITLPSNKSEDFLKRFSLKA